MINNILYIFYKDGKIKALSNGDPEIDKMEGWKHTATLNANIFVEHLFNDVPDKELKAAVNSLATI